MRVVTTPSAVARFLAKVDIDPATGCWNWTSAKHERGYGLFLHAQRQWRAHRLAYHWWKDELDPELVLDHLCRNTSCVNPDHLEQVTQKENLKRGDTFNRAHHEQRDCGIEKCKRCSSTYAAARSHRAAS